MFEDHDLEKQLDTLGWPSKRYGPYTLRCDHETEQGSIAVYLRLHDEWLIASVVPFLSTKGANPFALARWLLRMNRDMPMSKFAYDEDGDVVLTVEVPTENLDPGEIRAALEGLLESAQKHRATLREASKRGD